MSDEEVVDGIAWTPALRELVIPSRRVANPPALANHARRWRIGVPFDPEKPMVTSGVRLGTPAATSRGFGVAEFKRVGELIVETLDGLAKHGDEANASIEESVKQRVHELTRRFPIYA